MNIPLSCVKVVTCGDAGPAPALLNALTLIEYLKTITLLNNGNYLIVID